MREREGGAKRLMATKLRDTREDGQKEWYEGTEGPDVSRKMLGSDVRVAVK